jgi:hypothetical protein
MAIGCSGSKSCTDNECIDSLTVTFEDFDEWQPGEYLIVVGAYGECSGEIEAEGATMSDGGAMSNGATIFDCTEGEPLVLFGDGLLDVYSKVDTLRVEVFRDGDSFKNVSLSPEYSQPQPECQPGCMQANETIE